MKEKLLSYLNKLAGRVNAKLAAVLALAGISCGVTYCDVDVSATLNKTTDLVFKLITWGGIIITVVGVVMLGKAIMDAVGGQSQPGALGRALGVLILGVLMLAAKSILTALGVASTV